MKTTTEIIEIDWNTPEELDLSNPWREYARQYCSMPHYEIEPSTGGYKVAYFHPCHQYDECEICGGRKKAQEYRRLKRIKESGKVQLIEVDEVKAKKLIRKYGKDKVHRIARNNGNAAVFIETTDQLEDTLEITDEIIKELSDEIITKEDGRRPSGNLGKSGGGAPDREETEEKDKNFDFEVDWDTPDELYDPVKLTTRKMIIEFDSKHPLAPQNADQLQMIVWQEVDIYQSPTSHKELREGIKKLEDKWEAVCKRFDMSFKFYSKNLKEVNLYEVNWKWTKNKLKIE